MLLTTVLLLAMTRVWGDRVFRAAIAGAIFISIDLAFANLAKVIQGGWISLAIGASIFLIMATWRVDIDAVHRRLVGKSDAICSRKTS